MILNLVNPTNSDIKFKVSRFPDGQQNVTITKDTAYIIQTVKKVTIKSRLNNWLDLELIVCVVKSLRNLLVNEIILEVPYFLGSRSDRKFEEGGNNYLKQVISPVINSLNLNMVKVLDPHSYVLEACIDNLFATNNISIVQAALDMIYEPQPSIREFVLVSPDAGASHKIQKVADVIGYKGDIITCSKERDKEGKLTQVNVPLTDDYQLEKDIIIIDDICDGGRTFINIAKFIKENWSQVFKGKIYLIVTHGIFSNGLIDLTTYFDGIYTTNSYSEDKGWPRMHQELNYINVF